LFAREECAAPRFKVSDLYVVAGIVFGWTTLASIVNPIGDMPLNDDGKYAYAVRSVIETGHLKVSPWGAPNVVSQVYWGALFCLPHGFSYTALRLSTLTIALVALLALYGLMREAGASSTTALFGTLVLAFNPLFFELSFTFMTDVPFIGFTLVALYLLVRGVKRQSRMAVALGLLAACVALLTRQTGLALFFALSFCYLVKNGLSKRNVVIAAFPTLLGLGVQFSYYTWLKMTGQLFERYGLPVKQELDVKTAALSHAWTLIRSGAFPLSYLGLFLLPLLVFIGYGRLRDLWRHQKRIAIVAAAIWCTVSAALVLHGLRMPFVGNVLYDIGLGPALLRDQLKGLPTAGRAFMGVVTAISLLAVLLILKALISAVSLLVRTRGQHQDLLLLALTTGFIYFVPIALLPWPYDRYYLPLVPFVLLVLFVICRQDEPGSRRWTVAGVLCLSLYGAFAIAGTHDFLASNRTRWRALQELTQEKQIAPEQIDGGEEFNLSYNSPTQDWRVGDNFVVSFSPAEGYVESERYTFHRWLPPEEGTIFVLRKVPDAQIVDAWVPHQSLTRQLFSAASAKQLCSSLNIACVK
jgi:4-amino-4-deoxy-L-arabinose transferase-like glycosyltransferase